MKTIATWLGVVVGLGVGAQGAIAQVIPDGTLSTNVSQTGSNFTITNGNQVGTNLFHSFSQFSVPTGGSAYFNNALTIQNIFARITGGSASNIDGLIRANGSASLFLLNPAGILFGPNARLNLGGSFIASTANSIVFADGVEFSAVNPQASPLLTISVPMGLQMGSNPGSITIQGTGHTMSQAGPFAPYIHTNHGGLQVQPGKTLALVGGDVALTGGVLTAPGGRLELGSAQAGVVGLNASTNGWTLNYGGISSFRDIQLSQRAIADASGSGSGSIQLQGRQIIVRDGSAVFLNNQGNTASGNIDVRASELLELNGFDPRDNFRSSLAMQTTGTGAGGIIDVSTQRLRIIDGGFLVNLQANAVGGGSIKIQAIESIVLDAANSGDINIVATGLGTTTLASGPAGDVIITTPKFSILNGALAVASTAGSGSGGSFTINAEAIEIIGGSPQGNRNSIISASSLGSGKAGSITLNTRTLNLQDSGEVATFGNGTGDAGQVIINASEWVEVNGKLPQAANTSRINSSVQPARPFLRQIFNLPVVPSGSSGDIVINTSVLRVSNQGNIGVSNGGVGNAGNLRINAGSIRLDNNGSITATTAQGEGGNIFIKANDLIMRRGSLIVTNAGGSGNGGNITINAPIVLGVGNSDIAANAVQGRGGNIQITTQGLFGLKFRNQLTPENDITASSQFGVSGTVQVNTVGVDPNAGLVELPTEVVDPSQQIATGCAGDQGSSFVATGRGGIPENPTQQVRDDRPWDDVRDLSAYRQRGQVVTHSPRLTSPSPIVQATTWQRHPITGEVELIAAQPTQPTPFATCAIAP